MQIVKKMMRQTHEIRERCVVLYQNTGQLPQFMTPANDEEKSPCLTNMHTRLYANSNESNGEQTNKKKILPLLSIHETVYIQKKFLVSRLNSVSFHIGLSTSTIKKLCGMQTTRSRERDAKMPREKRTTSTNVRLPAKVPASSVARISRRHRKRQKRERRSARPRRQK